MKPQRIVLHGALGSAEELKSLWQPHPAFADALFLNFTGHGSRSNEPWSGRMEDLVTDLAHSLDQLGAEEVEIVGYSMGGYVALQLAARGDERITRIITLGTQFAWSVASSTSEAAKLDPANLLAKVPAYVESLQKLHGPRWETTLNNTRTLMQLLGEAGGFAAADLHRVFVPVVVCRAESDRMVTEETSRWAADQLPNATFAPVANSQHPPHKIDLDEFTASWA